MNKVEPQPLAASAATSAPAPKRRASSHKPDALGFQLIIIVLTVAIVALAPVHVNFIAVAENWLKDLRLVGFSTAEEMDEDIVILTLTEETLSNFWYRSPVDRGFLAEKLSLLAKTEARAVGLDILFDQPTEPVKDGLLKEVLITYPKPIVVGWTDRETGLTQGQYAWQQQYLEGIDAGFSNQLKDRSDDIVRRTFPGRDEENGWRPGFVHKMAEVVGVQAPREPVTIVYRLGAGPDRRVFRTFPIDALEPLLKAKPEWFKDKIVLIGADQPLNDRHRTPFAALERLTDETGDDATIDSVGQRRSTPGVVILAHSLATLLGKIEPVKEAPLILDILIALLLALLAVAISYANWPLWARGFVVVLVVVGLWGGAFALAAYLELLILLLTPSIAFVAATGAGGVHAAHLRARETAFVRRAFARYVAPGVLRRLEERPEALGLGGDRRDVTLLFTDVEGFTTLSEGIEPALLVSILNEYFDRVVEPIQKHGGMIDKFIGDAVMAIFGAPEPAPDHAARGAACAVEMARIAAAFSREQQAKGIDFGRTRIGVHSGSVVVGNVGGSERFDYTAIGDVVNTAARLEGANKYFGTALCVSGATVEAAGSGIAFRPIGSLVVKGRSTGIPVFTAVMEESAEQVEAYQQAFALLEARDTRAEQAFVDFTTRFPDDPLGSFHLERIRDGELSADIILRSK